MHAYYVYRDVDMYYYIWWIWWAFSNYIIIYYSFKFTSQVSVDIPKLIPSARIYILLQRKHAGGTQGTTLYFTSQLEKNRGS